mmetsp:Transcript_2413/g.6465  ORF Transcript_2413/g.6465 Transcript_2413/m.6465 type:complete len:243 (-) Transcript_2413:59-787(-)
MWTTYIGNNRYKTFTDEDCNEVKRVLEGLLGTMSCSERHNIMKEMRTISESILLVFVRRLLRARSKEFVLQLQVKPVPEPEWLLSFHEGRHRGGWYHRRDDKAKECIVKQARKCFGTWTRRVKDLPDADRKAQCQSYKMPDHTWETLVELLENCSKQPREDVVYGAGRGRAWLHSQWLDPQGPLTRFLNLLDILKQLHKVNIVEHQAQNLAKVDEMKRADIEKDFLNPLKKIFETPPNALMY